MDIGGITPEIAALWSRQLLACAMVDQHEANIAALRLMGVRIIEDDDEQPAP